MLSRGSSFLLVAEQLVTGRLPGGALCWPRASAVLAVGQRAAWDTL